MILETKRLYLRPFTVEDEEAVLNILGDEEVNRFLPMFPLKNIDEARKYLTENLIGGDKIVFAVCLKEKDEPIGYIHISRDEAHDLGYGLRRDFWHKGITTEAAEAVVKYAEEQNIPYLTATHDVNNPHSGGVMKNIGMQYQYTYEELWQPKNFRVYFRMYQLNFKDKNFVFRKYWDKYPVHFIEKNEEI